MKTILFALVILMTSMGAFSSETEKYCGTVTSIYARQDKIIVSLRITESSRPADVAYNTVMKKKISRRNQELFLMSLENNSVEICIEESNGEEFSVELRMKG